MQEEKTQRSAIFDIEGLALNTAGRILRWVAALKCQDCELGQKIRTHLLPQDEQRTCAWSTGGERLQIPDAIKAELRALHCAEREAEREAELDGREAEMCGTVVPPGAPVPESRDPLAHAYHVHGDRLYGTSLCFMFKEQLRWAYAAVDIYLESLDINL